MPEPLIGDDQLLRLMMYTSGTESRPKGVMHSSRSLMWQYMSTILAGSMTENDVEVHSMPLYHCAQLDNFLATDIFLGATSIIVPRPDPEIILPVIERYGVTNFFAPPTVWISLLRSPTFDSVDLSSLRKGYYGASAMPTEILAEMRQRMPNVALWNFYGQTEMAPLASALRPDEQAQHWARPVTRCPTSRPRSSTTRTSRYRPAGSARSPIAVRTSCSATSTTRCAPPRRSAAAGSIPGTSATTTISVSFMSWTARRT